MFFLVLLCFLEKQLKSYCLHFKKSLKSIFNCIAYCGIALTIARVTGIAGSIARIPGMTGANARIARAISTIAQSIALGCARNELFSKSYGAQGSNDATW